MKIHKKLADFSAEKVLSAFSQRTGNHAVTTLTNEEITSAQVLNLQYFLETETEREAISTEFAIQLLCDDKVIKTDEGKRLISEIER